MEGMAVACLLYLRHTVLEYQVYSFTLFFAVFYSQTEKFFDFVGSLTFFGLATISLGVGGFLHERQVWAYWPCNYIICGLN